MSQRRRKLLSDTLPLPFMRKPADTGTEADAEAPAEAAQTFESSDPRWVEYRRAFYEQRKAFLDALLDSYRSFDKTMITLSAGALGLSVAFVTQIAPDPDAGTTRSLHVTWLMFGTALVLILASFLTSQYAWRRAMAREDEAFANEGIPPEGGNRWSVATQILNIASLVAFALGGVAFVWFSTNTFVGGN